MNIYFKKFNLNYGKFLDKEFIFKNNLNIIYGNNESGKSTIHRFIISILYGQYNHNSKNLISNKSLKEGDRPWFSSSYYGSIEVEKNGENYHLYRNFENDEFSLINQSSGTYIDFDDSRKIGEYLFGLDKNTFSNVLAIDLEEPFIDDNAKESIKNSLTSELYNNYTINFDSAKESLIKRNNSIGTDRLSNKELGTINREIEVVNRKLLDIGLSKFDLDKAINEYTKVNRKFKAISKKLKYGKYMDELDEHISISDYEDLLLEIKDYNTKRKNRKNLRSDKDYFPILVIIIAIIILFFLLRSRILYLIPFLIVGLIYYYHVKRKDLQEIKDIEESIKDKFSKAGVTNIDEYRDLVSPGPNKNFTFITEDFDLSEIEYEYNTIKEEVESLKYNIDEIRFNLGKQRDLIEELDSLYLLKKDLLNEIEINNLILESFDSTENEILNFFKNDIVKNISEILKYLTNARYSKLLLDNNFNLSVYDNNKLDYIALSKLSSGTKDLINLAFRFAIHQYKSEYNLPLILDNTSNYLDSNRLERYFEFLRLYSNSNQILLFTNKKSELEKLKEFDNTNIIELSDSL